MINNKRIAVIVPAFNEESWIAGVIKTLPLFVDRVVVVDDASEDKTVACANQAQACCEKVILTQRRNEGVGAAILRGYRYAFEHGDDVMAVMAGDGQMDPKDLKAVVEPVAFGRADYVKGNRLRHSEVVAAMPRNRRLGSYVLSTLTSLVIGQVIGDSQCGYTALNRNAYSKLEVGQIWTRYGYPNDLLAALARRGARIQDVVVRPVYRGEASGMHVGHAALITALLARAGLRRWLQQSRQLAPLAGIPKWAWRNQPTSENAPTPRGQGGQ